MNNDHSQYIDLSPLVGIQTPVSRELQRLLNEFRWEGVLPIPRGRTPRPPEPAELQPEHQGYMRITEVCSLLGVSRASLYRWIGEGRFFAPTRLSARMSGWPRGKVYAYLRDMEGTDHE